MDMMAKAAALKNIRIDNMKVYYGHMYLGTLVELAMRYQPETESYEDFIMRIRNGELVVSKDGLKFKESE